MKKKRSIIGTILVTLGLMSMAIPLAAPASAHNATATSNCDSLVIHATNYNTSKGPNTIFVTINGKTMVDESFNTSYDKTLSTKGKGYSYAIKITASDNPKFSYFWSGKVDKCSIPCPTVTKTIIKEIPGPTITVTKDVPGPTITVTKDVPGPTVTQDIPGPIVTTTATVYPSPATVTVTKSAPPPVTITGPTVTAPGPTVTKNVPGPVVTLPVKIITNKVIITRVVEKATGKVVSEKRESVSTPSGPLAFTGADSTPVLYGLIAVLVGLVFILAARLTVKRRR